MGVPLLTKFGQFKGGNSRVPNYLVIYLSVRY